MNQPIQQRTLKTRARLIEAAREVVAEVGYDALRTEEVVRRAKVAKGTFFAHFHDKDTLLSLLIGAEMDKSLDRIAEAPAPGSVDDVVRLLMPLLKVMSENRTVFDVILRHSGAAAIDAIGPIAENIGRQVEVFATWFDLERKHPFRRDIAPGLLAEGIQAFAVQAMALNFCAINNAVEVEQRLQPYLEAWLMPAK